MWFSPSAHWKSTCHPEGTYWFPSSWVMANSSHLFFSVIGFQCLFPFWWEADIVQGEHPLLWRNCLKICSWSITMPVILLKERHQDGCQFCLKNKVNVQVKQNKTKQNIFRNETHNFNSAYFSKKQLKFLFELRAKCHFEGLFWVRLVPTPIANGQSTQRITGLYTTIRPSLI